MKQYVEQINVFKYIFDVECFTDMTKAMIKFWRISLGCTTQYESLYMNVGGIRLHQLFYKLMAVPEVNLELLKDEVKVAFNQHRR